MSINRSIFSSFLAAGILLLVAPTPGKTPPETLRSPRTSSPQTAPRRARLHASNLAVEQLGPSSARREPCRRGWAARDRGRRGC